MNSMSLKIKSNQSRSQMILNKVFDFVNKRTCKSHVQIWMKLRTDLYRNKQLKDQFCTFHKRKWCNRFLKNKWFRQRGIADPINVRTYIRRELFKNKW